VSARKIALLVLIVAFAAGVETAWNVRGDVRIGPEGCRVMGGRFYGPSWTFEAAAERAVAEAGAPRLEVENAFGEVSVSAGAPGVVKVKLRKVVFLPTEEKARAFADRIELRLTGDGAPVRVGTNRDELGRREDTGFETHLEIEAPPASVVEVRNEHGRVELSGVAAADVSSSFEGVSIERVAGDVKLEARHGDVAIDGIGGALELNARHGNVSVSGVAGACKLDVQHGNLEARRTAGLEVDLAHGTLTVENVADVVLRGQHAPVHGSDVAGRAEIETSFGDVRFERVGGELRARIEHGGVTASDVAGGANLETTFDGVTLERVAGPLEAVVQHGGVEARGLARGARIRASGADVTLHGFSGSIDLEVERGSARLAPGSVLDAEIVVQATHGDVQLEVPEGSRFDLEAESQRGRVDAPFEGVSTGDEQQRRGQRASGRHAGGGVSVRLKADGDVTLESRPVRSRDDWAVARPRVSEKPAAEAPAAAATTKPKPSPKAAVPAEAPAPTPPSPEQKTPDGASQTR
jgi:DUF4097 and DUF4098 domain-containing protein YvlB